MQQIDNTTKELIKDIDKLKTEVCLDFLTGKISKEEADQLIKILIEQKEILEGCL